MNIKIAFCISSLFFVECASNEFWRKTQRHCRDFFARYPNFESRYSTRRLTNKECRYVYPAQPRRTDLLAAIGVRSAIRPIGAITLKTDYYEKTRANDYYCNAEEPLSVFCQLAVIDCGPYTRETCIYRQALLWMEREKYVLIDGARIVKKIKKVEKRSFDYNVTLILSLGNGTYTNLIYRIIGNSVVKAKEDDPFYFSEQDLLRLSREATFPICIYRASDSLHSKYYPCRDRLPKEYFWNKRFDRWYKEWESPKIYGLYHMELDDFGLGEALHEFHRNRECFRVLCDTDGYFFPAYIGFACEHNIDECAFGVHDCPEGRLCHDTDTSFYCECPEGTTGAECKDDIDECDEGLHECPIYSTCANTNGSYICKCPPWLTGKDCSEFINYCKIYQPCQNGGECHAGQNDYTCTCAAGYTGKNCTDNINECASNPCKHGTCIDEVNKYKCACDPKYTGRLCDVDINECEKLKCVNGTCVRLDEAKYKCECFPGYNGELCDIDIDECSDGTPCGRSGTCRNTVGSFTCECENGFTGKRCEKEIYECESSPCQNGGYCLDGVGDYICLCPLGYDGTHCEHLIDHCKEHECENGGTCENLPYGYSCVCPSYAKGAFCEDLVDYCTHEDQCGRGYCHSLKGSYECICLEGYTGTNCELTVDPCVGIDCRNGGKCTPSDAEVFNCNCPQGTSGKYCEWRNGCAVLQIRRKLLFVASAFLAIRNHFLI